MDFLSLRAILHDLGAGARLAYARRATQAGYWQVDARLRFDWRGAQLSLDGRNLTNDRHLDISSLPSPGRAVYIGLGLGRD